MCGETCGSLRVLQEKYKNTTELFSISGEQSNSSTNWKIASLSINHSVHQRVSVEHNSVYLINVLFYDICLNLSCLY